MRALSLSRSLALSLARALSLSISLSLSHTHTHAPQDLPAFGAFVTGWTEVTKDVVAALAAAEGADDDMAASVPRYNACIYKCPEIQRMHLPEDTTHAFTRMHLPRYNACTSVPTYNACIYPKIQRMHLHACIYRDTTHVQVSRDTTHAFTRIPRYMSA